MRSDSGSGSDNDVTIKVESRSPSPAERRTPTSKKSKSDKEMIAEHRFRHTHSIKEYLKKRDSLTIHDTSRKESVIDADHLLGSDEEIWLIQCPQDVNIEALVGTKLNFDGERHKVKGGQAPLEYHSEELAKERFVSLMCKSKDSHAPRYQLRSLKPAGVVRVQAKLQEPSEPEIIPTKQARVPYPTEIKVRHPLHGIHYAGRTELPENVRKSLSLAVAASNVARSQVVIKKEENDDVDMDDGFSEPTVRKAKKRKAPKEEEVSDDGENVVKSEDAPRKAKRSKKVKVEENGDVNLDWLAAI